MEKRSITSGKSLFEHLLDGGLMKKLNENLEYSVEKSLTWTEVSSNKQFCVGIHFTDDNNEHHCTGLALVH